MVNLNWKNLFCILVSVLLVISFILPHQLLIRAGSNTPQNKGNGWWNSTVGSDWLVNTTGNLWVDRNITIFDSMIIKDGGIIVFQNCTIIVHNNIEVQYNASLTLINTTIKFNGNGNCTAGLSILDGGSLYIFDYDNDPGTIADGSNITSNITDNKHRYYFIISHGANFSMLNSELHQCGSSEFFKQEWCGAYIRSDNSTINNNTFSDNHAGLIVESANNTIENNIVKNNEKYGILIMFHRNNSVHNNTLLNNKFNFGMIFFNSDQINNITTDNTVDGRPIYYYEGEVDFDPNISVNAAGFIGIVNCSNLTIADQDMSDNFEGMVVYNSNKFNTSNMNFTNGFYGVSVERSENINLFQCNFSNNDFVGLNVDNMCQNITAFNSTLYNNSIGIQITNSNLTIINSSIKQCVVSDMYLNSNSYICVINSTFDKNNVDVTTTDSKVVVKKFLHIRTRNHTGINIGNVSLDIYNGADELVYKGATNSTGFVSWIPLTQFEITKSGINNSNRSHNIHAKYAGIEFINHINITKTENITIYLNHPPNIINPPGKTVYIDEDSNFYYDFNFNDIDSDPVTWNFITNASWLKPIEKYTGIINDTPLNSDIGIFFVNVTCNDSFQGIGFYNFSLIVNNTNDPLQIVDTMGAKTAYEDVFYFHDFNVTDPDVGDDHTWFLETNASWLNPIHAKLGRLSGFPRQKDVGEYYVNVSCTDLGSASDFFNYSLRVFAVNDQPIITNPPPKLLIINEDELYYYDFDYIDHDGETVIWHRLSNATWLFDINSSSGELEGIPHNNDVGFFFINISCMDQNNSFAFWNYTIEVRNTNDPPTFIGPIPETLFVPEDEYFEYNFTIDDPDRFDTFKFSYNVVPIATTRCTTRGRGAIEGTNEAGDRNAYPSWLKLVPNSNARNCMIFGMPSNDDVGKFQVNISVSDLKGSSSVIEFSIKVNNTNDRPIITNPERDVVFTSEDSEYYYDFDFIDVDGDTVTWSVSTNATWLSVIDGATGELSGTPLQADLGIYFVEVTCYDPFNDHAAQNYTLQVNNTNDPPIIINPSPKIVYILEDQRYQYDFDSKDIDSANLLWASHTNASWLSPVNPDTGIILGTPSDDDIGQFFINVSCWDDQLNNTHWNYTLIVNNTNDAPVILNGYLAPKVANLNEYYYFKFKFYDADGDIINWGIITNASNWLKFDKENSAINGTPKASDIGLYFINITCEDPSGAVDFYEFVVHVKQILNQRPELYGGYVEPASGDTSTYFRFYVTYRDSDNDKPIAVIVKINGVAHTMSYYSGDNILNGVNYSYRIRLSPGNHSFYFQANDIYFTQAQINDDTPILEKPGFIQVSEAKPITEGLWNIPDHIWYFFIFIIIFIIIGNLFVGVYTHRWRKSRTVAGTSTADGRPGHNAMKPGIGEARAEVEVKRTQTGKRMIISKNMIICLNCGTYVDKTDLKCSQCDTNFLEPDEAVVGKEKSDIMLCPKCSEFVDESFNNCPKCGVKFIFDREITDDMEDEVLLCPKCNEFVDESYETCPNCGITFFFEDEETSSGLADDVLVCPECGELVDESYEKCPNCDVQFTFDEEMPGELKEVS